MADPLETPDVEDKYVDPTGAYPDGSESLEVDASALYDETLGTLVKDSRTDKTVPVREVVPEGATNIAINDDYARYSMLITTTPVKVALRNVNRLKIWIQNNGTDFVAFGGPDVAAATDLRLVPGATMTDDELAYTDEWWLVANSGSQAVVIRDESRRH